MATSEDEDRTPASSIVQSTDDDTESYTGDATLDIGGTIDDDDAFDDDDDDFDFDDDFEDGDFDDDGYEDGRDAINGADGLNGFDDDRAGRGPRDVPPPLPQHNFAPPFYGRPPTPLPPSPSLTSLLRPSRPTTPDATDDELEPVPRAAPQVPTYEYYGFVLYLFSSLAFLMYLLWSYLPSPFLHALGIYYYPNRWWSLAIPSFLVMTLVYIYVALASYNTEILTLPLDCIETIVDGAAKLAAVDEDGCVVIIGGADGTQVQGRGLTAGDVQQKKDQGQRQSLYGQAQAFAHQRSPSSPSPPLGVWQGSKKSKKSKASRQRADKSERTETGSNNDSRTSTTTPEDGITMGRGRAWNHSRSTNTTTTTTTASTAYSNQSYGYISHRSPGDWNRLWNVGTDAVMDIPLAGVCEVLYGE